MKRSALPFVRGRVGCANPIGALIFGICGSILRTYSLAGVEPTLFRFDHICVVITVWGRTAQASRRCGG
jgi:hypothetical protein